MKLTTPNPIATFSLQEVEDMLRKAYGLSEDTTIRIENNRYLDMMNNIQQVKSELGIL